MRLNRRHCTARRGTARSHHAPKCKATMRPPPPRLCKAMRVPHLGYAARLTSAMPLATSDASLRQPLADCQCMRKHGTPTRPPTQGMRFTRSNRVWLRRYELYRHTSKQRHKQQSGRFGHQGPRRTCHHRAHAMPRRSQVSAAQCLVILARRRAAALVAYSRSLKLTATLPVTLSALSGSECAARGGAPCVASWYFLAVLSGWPERWCTAQRTSSRVCSSEKVCSQVLPLGSRTRSISEPGEPCCGSCGAGPHSRAGGAESCATVGEAREAAMAAASSS
mmetsp:Transcript_51391/g.118081  ORF Transcript_51391/g.118081 Transcript_51391/m.118081 type:complete len:279 (-) Transcript_51391:767-1603(-)